LRKNKETTGIERNI